METAKNPPNGTESDAAVLTARTAVRALWRRPAMAVARALLWDYLASGQIVGEAAVLAIVFLVAFHNAGDPAHFFEAASAGLGVLAVAGAALTVMSTFQPSFYTPLAERYGREACVRGLALALVTIRLGSYLYLLVPALLTGRIVGASFGAMLAGTLGLLANVILLALVTVALCPPFATSRERMGFLGWLVAALYSYVDSNLLARICVIARLPLLPLAACFDSGITGELGWGGLLALLIVAGYALGLVRLLEWRLETLPKASMDPSEAAAATTERPNEEK